MQIRWYLVAWNAINSFQTQEEHLSKGYIFTLPVATCMALNNQDIYFNQAI